MIHLDLAKCTAGQRHVDASAASLYDELSEISIAVANSRRVVVITGAGISCSSGIPVGDQIPSLHLRPSPPVQSYEGPLISTIQDFRSKNGLYSLVKGRHPNAVLKGEELFSAQLFRDSGSIELFLTLMAELKIRIDEAFPGPTHRFLMTLHCKGRLLRSYTQNIDGFEEMAGLPGCTTADGNWSELGGRESKIVQLHGDIQCVFRQMDHVGRGSNSHHSRVRCRKCNTAGECTQVMLDSFLVGVRPECPGCLANRE